MARMNEVAARIMEHLCEHEAHGYTQGARWGNGRTESINVDGQEYYFAGGDRDCSSAIISAYQSAGLPVNATYTGNMKDGFLATGMFEWHGMDFVAQRGDIYLNHVNHTAMCTSAVPDMLAEFTCSENGGIYGEEGDQTGTEGYIHGYYNYPWDGILHFVGGEAQGGEPMPAPPSEELPYLRFRLFSDGRWLNDNDEGILGMPITRIAVDFGGCGWYQVATEKHGWLPPVTGYDMNDDNNGYAGWEDSPIVAVRCYYDTPDPASTGYLCAKYRVSNCWSDWFDWQIDNDTWNGQDGYAGDMKLIDRFYIEFSR